MAASSREKRWTQRLRRVVRRLFPIATLRARGRAVDRLYRPQIAREKGVDREALESVYGDERASVEEELEGLQTQRLIKKARKYYIVIPEVPWFTRDEANWERGHVSEIWYLKPAAVASLRRQIEEAKSRRREAWATWAKILSGLISGLVALASVLVSLILAWRR